MEQKSQTRNLVLFMMIAMGVIFSASWLQDKFIAKPRPKAKTPQELAKKVDDKKAEDKKGPAEKPVEVKPTPPKRPRAKADQFTLGSDDAKIKAVLSTQGAAVTSLTLTQFKTSTIMGRPEDKALELLPENQANPSFAIYDYARPEDPRPVDTLGVDVWKLERAPVFDESQLTWTAVFSIVHPDKPIKITKTFTLHAKEYHVGLKIGIERTDASKDTLRFRYQLEGGHGLPIEGQWYTTIFRQSLVGSVTDKGNFVRGFRDSRQIDLMKGSDKLAEGHRIIYAATAAQYFASAICVDDQQQDKNFLAWSRATEESNTEPPERGYLNDIVTRVMSKELSLEAGAAPITHQYLLYHGPVKVMLLSDRDTGGESVSPELVKRYTEQLHLNTLTDYHMQGAGGPFLWISENVFYTLGWTSLIITCTNLMHTVLAWLHTVIPSYGLCIFVLTLLVRGIMFPITRRQALMSRDMQEKMKVLKPEMEKIKAQHKDDFAALTRAQSELYKKHNVNPLAGLGGCLPLLLQMPIFMGLYYCLQESIHFRLAKFLWIENLAAPDMLVWWGEKIPWISTPNNLGGLLYLGPYFNLLPVIAVALMMVQQAMLMPPPTDEQTAMQQKMMKYMTIFMGIMFYKMAAGLCVYFIVSSLWGLTERKLLPKSKLALPGEPVKESASNNKSTNRSKPGKGGTKNGKPESGMMGQLKTAWEDLLKQASKRER